MTSVTDICNRALQAIGTRTTVTDAELANETSNEAIQFNLVYENYRDDLLRMAPWNCAMRTANLTYISSVPGTPENSSPATNLWQPGQPAPPWAYEYQYPVDCLRAVMIIPANQTGFASGVPITTAVTGGAAAFWSGPPVRFRVNTDLFYPVTAAAVVAGGTGYAVGDIITLPIGPTDEPPIGAPVQLRVATLGVGSAVATVAVVNQIAGSATPLGGSYFAPQTGTIAQDTTTGSGTGATFTLTFGSQGDQRVILTNQEFATLAYCRQVTDPNVWDTLFQSALISAVAGGMYMALRGNASEANRFVERINRDIEEARSIDGNEGFIVNDVTPDFIRIRGIAFDGMITGPYSNFDWGGGWPNFA
jgi:hypothetical protein